MPLVFLCSQIQGMARGCLWMGSLRGLELCGAVVRRPSGLTQVYGKAVMAGEAAIMLEAFRCCWIVKKVLESLFIKGEKEKFENPKQETSFVCLPSRAEALPAVMLFAWPKSFTAQVKYPMAFFLFDFKANWAVCFLKETLKKLWAKHNTIL